MALKIQYSRLGADKKLRDVVLAGSHDAGITAGGGNAKTQNEDIWGQACCGVRVFDLRIRAGAIGNNTVQLRAYHADKKMMSTANVRRKVDGFEDADARRLKRTKIVAGTWGMDLKQILEDAALFVWANRSEFLILKFDKCTNWDIIAEYCAQFLGDQIYTGTGDLNRKTLGELAGKVVVLFSESGVAKVRQRHPLGSGILAWRNLNGDEKRPYEANFDGMQYLGKGGTAVFTLPWNSTNNAKVRENIAKQTKRMEASTARPIENNSNVLGMMYWTTTGLTANIEQRNDSMWSQANIGKLQDLWKGGLEESIMRRIGGDAKRIKRTRYASGVQMKAFMPNIVMIDFADQPKCDVIYALNAVASTRLSEVLQAEG